MRIEEFWNIAPCEASEYLEEATKRDLEAAWRYGVMHHTDPKKFPKRPEQLWDPKAPDQAPELMRTLAAAMASNGSTFFKEAKTKH